MHLSPKAVEGAIRLLDGPRPVWAVVYREKVVSRPGIEPGTFRLRVC